jgi:hypothetical protein
MRRSMKRQGKRVLGTTHRGRTKVTSQKEMDYMEAHHIDHTHYAYTKGGNLKHKSRHTWPESI